jgi:hypothetical protein
VTALMGSPEGRLDRVRWKNRATGEETERGVHNLFLYASAEPAADWLRDCSVTLDSNGFVKTGSDATAGPARSGHEVRAPTAHQSSVPGVFAVGDVRSGSVKRAAIGEGAAVVAEQHAFLGRTSSPSQRPEPVAALLEGDAPSLGGAHCFCFCSMNAEIRPAQVPDYAVAAAFIACARPPSHSGRGRVDPGAFGRARIPA